VKLMSDSFVLQDLVRSMVRLSSWTTSAVRSLSRVGLQPSREGFRGGRQSQEHSVASGREEMKGKVSLWQLVRDAMAARKTI